MSIFWRILKSKRRIGKPYRVQYGFWKKNYGAFADRYPRKWVTLYEEEYGTEQEARDVQKYPTINGHPVVGELPQEGLESR